MTTVTIGKDALEPSPAEVTWRGVVAALVLVVALAGGSEARAQAPLILVDDSTTVSGISFRFADSPTFEPGRLKEQIALEEPKFNLRLFLFGWFPGVDRDPIFFDPIGLQKDVVRLRRFYERNGFPKASIDYPASQLDTASNEIRVVFTVDEGPPLIIQDAAYLGPDGDYVVRQFSGREREAWLKLQDRLGLQVGDRFTEFERTLIQSRVLAWLKERGYAFAQTSDSLVTYLDQNAVDLYFRIDPGPRAYVSEIRIEGNESVPDRVLTREVPLEVGDLFSSSKLSTGQQDLFGLGLFRLAVSDVPPQPVDSSVVIRYRVREAEPRVITVVTGYSAQEGLSVQTAWQHRNFFGGARNFTVTALANSGIGATPGQGGVSERLFRFSALLRQPYLFNRRMSGSVEPFVELARDPLLADSDDLAQINRREVGATTSLLYDLLPYRSISVQYTVSRTQLLTDIRQDLTAISQTQRDFFNLSVLSASATLGRVNDFLKPRVGFLVRPSVAIGGIVLNDVTFQRAGLEVVRYQPLTRNYRSTLRITTGRLWPKGVGAFGGDPIEESRFDPIRYYAGGSNDVRGWNNGLVGSKRARAELRYEDDGETLQRDDDGIPLLTNPRFEPEGGTGKLAVSAEISARVGFLPPILRLATFLDAGAVSDAKALPTDFAVGTGLGLRYDSPFGYARFDIGYKLNPSPNDLRQARDVFLYENREALGIDGLVDPPEDRFLRRMTLHLSIGQAF